MKVYKETTKTLLFKSLSDLTIYNAGYEKCLPQHSYGPAFREHHLIHFVIEGKGKLYIDQHEFHLQKGDAFIIPSKKVAYYQSDASEPWHYAWIGYLGINAGKYTYQLMSSSLDAYVLHQLDMQKYMTMIQKIIDLKGNTTSLYLKANSVLLDFMGNLFEELDIKDEPTSQATLTDEIKLFMEINYPEISRISEIADTFQIHPNYLSRIFTEKFEISPKRYLTNLKLMKACELLLTTDHPVSVIAYSLGFDDQLAFSKLFKKNIGVSPTAYKQDTNIHV